MKAGVEEMDDKREMEEEEANGMKVAALASKTVCRNPAGLQMMLLWQKDLNRG